jgi:hypothetical protein
VRSPPAIERGVFEVLRSQAGMRDFQMAAPGDDGAMNPDAIRVYTLYSWSGWSDPALPSSTA